MIERRAHRLRQVYAKADRDDAAGCAGMPITCRSGCAACCHQWIGVQYLEAEMLVDEARRVGHLPLETISRLATKADHKGMTRQAWFGTPCPMLTEARTCAVYSVRPLACRAVHVVSDPVLCSLPHGTVQKVDNRRLWQHAARAIQSEHMQLSLAPVVAALPLMMQLVLQGDGPSRLGMSVGVYGLAEYGTDGTIEEPAV